ncbi:hypothetical protein SAY87_030756 [Trapa incisa]|uniref:Rho GDP-dissociation inhibitor 1-like n=2 Tax=Trapa TaxID=22665 RepID=A0AAN7R0E8_TRANT|nr:hypothetical protein SAY87_030756 [Trapa incisa]KAK4786949.1 hypothetical protein SAY86_010782 [Trapa natans]
MSLDSGAALTSKEMGFQETKEAGENSGIVEAKTAEMIDGNEDNGPDDEAGVEEGEDESKLHLGPRFSLRQQLEKDKEDESLRRWKEKLLGSVDFDNFGDVESFEPEVKILSLSIISPDRPDLVLPVPENGNPNGLWFTLKEGSHYRLRFTLQVSNNIVSGLTYINTVWKAGFKVDNTREMLGTFSPQLEPYTHVTHEEITPSGILARGSYSARSKFIDDDDKCYLEIKYSFDIQKEWAAP